MPPPSDGPRQARRKLKLIVTGGHPGDPEYGCGGTIARYTDLGHEVVLLYLNKGECRPESRETAALASPRPRTPARSSRRVRCTRDRSMARRSSTLAHYEAFRKILEAERPDVVFTHWPIDNHADHRAISMLVYDAWLRMEKRFALYYYEVSNGEDTVQFFPNSLRGHHADRTTKTPGLLRARQPDPRPVLYVARTSHPVPRDRKRLPTSRGLHPPRTEPRFGSPRRTVAIIFLVSAASSWFFSFIRPKALDPHVT